MNKLVLKIMVILGIVSCGFQFDVNKKESWKSENYIDSVQILLTNKYHLNESYSYGGSSFLIKSNGDTFLCTAKHLLGKAMGIRPEVKTKKFNASLKYWKAYPRSGKISEDTVYVSKLITEKQNDIDIILLDCDQGKENNIVPLTPRFTVPSHKERFEIIGCQYADTECHQRRYFAIMDSYDDGQLFLKSEDNFSPSGFSGAPVIDSNGLVIGLLSGGGEFEGILYLAIEPISKIEDYLK